MLLATYKVLDLSSLEESFPLPVAGVTAHDADVTDLTDVMAQLKPHVNVLEYPATKPALLQLLAKHRQAIALPGEPLGVTTEITHHIALQPSAQPSYVLSYRLPHSQRQVVQQRVDKPLQGVIQESQSPWNSPLFLVPKKEGSYRPVIDFRKVNALTIPYHYTQPNLKWPLRRDPEDFPSGATITVYFFLKPRSTSLTPGSVFLSLFLFPYKLVH